MAKKKRQSNAPKETRDDPRTVYRDTHRSLVFRLSEAMFASLLASYIIGFAGLIHGIWENKTVDNWIWVDICLSLNVVLVSSTFAFITTAVYVQYNMSILTLRTYALQLTARDFAIAVWQGMLFGLVLVQPLLLLFAVASILALSFMLFQWEIHRLAQHLYEAELNEDLKRQVEMGWSSAAKKDKQLVLTLIQDLVGKEYPPWKVPSLKFAVCLIVGLLLGSLVPFIAYWLVSENQTWNDRILWASLALNCCVFALSLISAYRVSSEGGKFIKQLRSNRGQAARKVYADIKEGIRSLTQSDVLGIRRRR